MFFLYRSRIVEPNLPKQNSTEYYVGDYWKEREKLERKTGEKKVNKNKATLLVSTYKGFFVRVVRLKALLVPCSFKLFLIGTLLYTTLFHIYACVKN